MFKIVDKNKTCKRMIIFCKNIILVNVFYTHPFIVLH